MFLLTLIAGFLIGYTLTIFYLHSVRLPNLSVNKLKIHKDRKTNVLFIYPHPDDEIMISGGLISKLSRNKDFNLFVVDITKGERGDELLKLPPQELGKVRVEEFYKALKTLQVMNSEIWDFPDGAVPTIIDDLKKKIKDFIKENEIDIVITFERWGIYGHQDHVALSKVVHEIGLEDVNLKILYSTISPQMAKMLNLKQHIKGLDLENFETNIEPEFKVPTFLELFKQYKAVKNYKSQNLSHKYPLWVTILMNPYEYYTTKY